MDLNPHNSRRVRAQFQQLQFIRHSKSLFEAREASIWPIWQIDRDRMRCEENPPVQK